MTRSTNEVLRWATDWLDAHAEVYAGKQGTTAFDVAVRLETELRTVQAQRDEARQLAGNLMAELDALNGAAS